MHTIKVANSTQALNELSQVLGLASILPR